MTKKSAARVERDLAKKEFEKTAAWDDVNAIHMQCCKLLISHTALSGLIQNPEVIAEIQDKALFTKNVHMLSADLTALSNELAGLKKLHEGKSGRASTYDDHLYAIEVYEKYVIFISRHDSVVMPTANHLAEQVQDAVDRVNRKKADMLTPEQDPNVVTDVEVREASDETPEPQVH